MRKAPLTTTNDSSLEHSDDSILVIHNDTPVCVFPKSTHFSQIIAWVKSRLNQMIDYTFGFRLFHYDIKRTDDTTKVIQYSRKPMDLMSRDVIEHVVIITPIANTSFIHKIDFDTNSDSEN